VGLASGVQRSFRPLPRQRTCAPAPSETSSCRNAVISDNRRLSFAITPSARNKLTSKRMKANNRDTCQPFFCL
jgi:hypothetical protein